MPFSYNLRIEILHCIQDFFRTKFGIWFVSEKKMEELVYPEIN